ncbi:hypothetical protein Q8A73_002994 [Channa argus]|nr:hypothetical protein Q8A73_002994 [Channa argus]
MIWHASFFLMRTHARCSPDVRPSGFGWEFGSDTIMKPRTAATADHAATQAAASRTRHDCQWPVG